MNIFKTAQTNFAAERTVLPGQTHDQLYCTYLLHFNLLSKENKKIKLPERNCGKLRFSLLAKPLCGCGGAEQKSTFPHKSSYTTVIGH
jgi:hypothetical protein